MLFGGKKKDDENDDDAMKKMGEQMQKLSEQIGKLQQELNAKTAEADQLRKQASNSSANEAMLKDAQAQEQVLRTQIKDMQTQLNQASAATSAATSSAASDSGTVLGSFSTKATQQEAAPAPAAGGLSAGATAYVTRAGGLPLRMRSGPSLNESILDRLQPGSQMTLLDGPKQADGHGWWHIRTADGREGWVAGEDLRTQPD